jgi:hypothetical protein
VQNTSPSAAPMHYLQLQDKYILKTLPEKITTLIVSRLPRVIFTTASLHTTALKYVRIT